MEQKTFNNLYSSRYNEIKVKFEEYPDNFDLELYGLSDRKPDCCVSHFGYNFYFRTNKGLKYEKYKNWEILKREVIKKSKKLGLTVEGFYFIKQYYNHKTLWKRIIKL